VIDAMWDKAAKLEITPTVPDPGNGLFAGYIGDKYLASLRSMYDDQYIYFLAEYADKDQNQKVAPWYFNPTTKLWAKESSGDVFDVNGVLTRQGFGEDKMAMLWNIDNSTPKFISQTCYASCHVFTPYYDYSTVGTLVAKVGKTVLDSLVTNPTYKSNSGSGNHYTNGPNEKIDMWWMQPSKGLSYGKMDDNYQDYAGGQAITNLTGGNANGRHVDDVAVASVATVWPFRPVYTADATQGSFANTQNLKLDGTGATVAVPMYVIPGSTTARGELIVLVTPKAKTEWIKSATQNFIAVSATTKEFDEATGSTTITKAKLKIDTLEGKMVHAKLLVLSDTIWKPMPGVEMVLAVKRIGGNLNINETATYVTDTAGNINAEFKRDSLPGDSKGNLVLVANVIDNDVYGNLTAESTVPWGAKLIYMTNYNHRSLFARRGHSPYWLEFLAYGIILAVWVVIIYLLIQIKHIVKLGLD